MKSILTPLAKSILIPLELSTGMSEVDGAIQKIIFWSCRSLDLASRTTALLISNEEMRDMMKIVKSLEESGLIIKRNNETIKNGLSANINFSKTQLPEIVQLGGYGFDLTDVFNLPTKGLTS